MENGRIKVLQNNQHDTRKRDEDDAHNDLLPAARVTVKYLVAEPRVLDAVHL